MFQNGGDPHLANTNNAQLNPNNNNITNNNNGNSVVSSSNSLRRSAVVKIVEQPASKALRFRYECEGRSAGSIPGVNSTPENKTYPSIQVNGYRGRAVVVVSCVTKDAPYRPHPHNLVGKDGCKKGVCTVEINSANMAVTFSNLGIQCVKKKDIEEALKQREEIRVDPFRTGFSHRQQPSTIDLNAVRLCFQVFLEGETRGRFTVPLPPVVSDIIYDKKAMSDLVICKLSDCSCSVAGGREIILLCEKVAKEDISVRFYEERDGHLYWEGLGEFQHTNVHKQVAISFRTPRYKTLEIDQPVKAYIQLKRPTDGATSEPLPFEFLPLDSDPGALKRKRQKFGGEASSHLFRQLQAQEQQHDSGRKPQTMAFLNIPPDPIKTEPRDTSPTYILNTNNNYRVPQESPSPQPMSPAGAGAAASTTPLPIPMSSHFQHQNSQNNNAGSITPTPSPFNLETHLVQQPGNVFSNMNFNNQNYPQFSNALYGSQMAATTNNYNLLQPQQRHLMNNLNSNNFNVDNLITNTQAEGATATTTNILIDLTSSTTNLSSLLDMDTESLQFTQLNSADWTGLLESGNYSNMDLIKQEHQNKLQHDEENMTDSFTRLTTETINNIGDLNTLYNKQQ